MNLLRLTRDVLSTPELQLEPMSKVLRFTKLKFPRPQEIDEAARRRLVKRLYIPLPEREARRQIISNLLKEQRYSLTEDEFKKLVDRSEGWYPPLYGWLCKGYIP